VEECGFESGEKGYVFMQCVMAEHQTDPLIGKYIGSAMMKVLQSAGVDLSAAMQQAKD
jgi:predicted Fe-Mo cluster-binding NifX family protein